MSSTTNNQSAETLITDAMTLNLADIDIAAPKLNKVGGKSANILNKLTKKGLYLNMQVPLLTWGANVFKDQQSGKETFDLALQFPRDDYSTPETKQLLSNFQALEKKIKQAAITNSMAWFNKKTMTPEVIEALWTPLLKYPKDVQTGEPDVSKAPTLKVKLPCWDGKFDCEIYDPNGRMLFPDENAGATPMDLIPKGVNIVAIIQCGGLWFANGKFGCTWKLFQAVVQPKPSMKGRCLIAVSSEAKAALIVPPAATSQSSGSRHEDNDEHSLEIEDDSDVEPESAPAPTPVPAVVQQAPVVVAEAPVAAVAVAVAVAVEAGTVSEDAKPKKKVVRKKE
jgi:hypothetical protein